MPKNDNEIVPQNSQLPPSFSTTSKELNKNFSTIIYYGWKIRCFFQKWNVVIPFITLTVLILNLIYFWSQYDLTQTLNQPLCAVKEVKVLKVRDDVIQISAAIKNYGNYAAKNTSISWGFFVCPDIKNKNSMCLETNLGSKGQTDITVLPQHEFETLLSFINKTEFNKIVIGYDAALAVILTIDYQDMDNIIQRYSCSYLVTRLLIDKQDTYEVSLKASKLEEIRADVKKKG